MSYFIGLVLSAIFLALAAFHFYWVSGGKWGVTAAIPASEKGEALFRPGLVATLAVAFGLLAMGVFALIKAGLVQLGLPEVVSKYGLWALAGIFLLRAFGDFRYVGTP